MSPETTTPDPFEEAWITLQPAFPQGFIHLADTKIFAELFFRAGQRFALKPAPPRPFAIRQQVNSGDKEWFEVWAEHKLQGTFQTEAAADEFAEQMNARHRRA